MLGPLQDILADIDQPLTTRQRERAELAQRNGLRLQKLVNTLLDFSRAEAGRVQAVYRPTDLGSLTRDLASNFRAACEKAGLSLTIDAPPLAEPVFVDHEMWEKIVLNLISNAFKFTFEGGILLALKAEGGDAVLTVRDSGVGIAEHELPRIFDRFHRIANARSRTHEGTGIGLALVKELVHQHKGLIEVASRPGQGTTFTVRMPFGRAHLPGNQISSERGHQSMAPGAEAFVTEASRWLPDDGVSASETKVAPATGPRPSLLIADDNADMRDYLRQLLGGSYRVTSASDGESALAAIRSAKPDILLSDVMMPGRDGHGLLEAVRSDPALSDLPVVLLSARAGEDATIEGLKAGADDYLVKPFSARELLSRLAASLERARSRRDLHDSDERFRALVNATSDVVYQMSPDWREMRALFGRGFLADTDAPSVAWIDDYILPEDQQQILAAIAEAISTKSPFQLEHRVRLADGSIGWTFSRAVPLLDQRGVITGWFGAAVDVTASRSAQADLLETEERLRLAVENAEVGFWDVDTINDKLVWPPRTKAMFGISPDVPVSMADFYEGLHPEDREETSQAYAAATDPARRALYDVEYRTVGKEDGLIRWVAAKGRGVFDDQSRCVRVAGTAIDVTARKRTEEALRDLTETLELRVAERTAALQAAHEQLRQVQKLEAMGSLTGGVAHDFNNLLTPIVGALDLLQRRSLGGERERKLIDGAAQAADRAKTLVQRLLAFARRQPLQPISVDVAGLVRSLADLVASTTGPQIEVVVDTPDKMPAAKADPGQLEMALLNLSVNARDAMPSGGRLCITASAQVVSDRAPGGLDAGRYIRLSVADTGVGMDEATKARAVEPFFSTKGVGKGTGLGLSMAHGLALQLGGMLKVESALGQGTTIELWLPATDEIPATTGQTQDTFETPAQGTALLVEDEDIVRLTTADMLSDLGYKVVEANSAEAGLEVLRNGIDISLVVTDHLMPGMTGSDLARAAKMLRPDIPILVISGYAESEGIERDLPRLTKPFRKDELAASLSAIKPA